MSECKILWHAEPTFPGQISGTFRCVGYCEAHGMSIGPIGDTESRCALGKIEDATEAAIERIKASSNNRTPST